LTVRLTVRELDALKALAEGAAKSTSEWARERLLGSFKK
jgi:hypothetical protein